MSWFLRIEDIDPPREQPGAVARIKQQCESHGLAWDAWPETKGGRADGVLYQSDRTDPAGPYAKALQQLVEKAMAFRCQCSRSVLQQVFATSRADDAWSTDLASEDNPATTSNRPYPGLCRNKKLSQGRAWRFRSPEVREGLGEDDFILQRADGLWAYHLAAVIDDQWQGITRIVRGEDLQPMQRRHQWLQEALGLARPDYLHVPVVTNAMGQKLSKQTQAEALRTDEASVRQQLAQATEHLRKTMPMAWLDQVSPAAKAMGLRWS